MSDRVAIVSGAARGIGEAVCRRLAEVGWVTVGIDLDDAAAATESVHGDAAEEATWTAALRAAGGIGSLGAVVNNAGVQGRPTLLADLDLADHRHVLRVNVDSAFLGTRLGLRELGEGGSVVNIASNAGRRGVPRYGPYVAAKHAVVGLTRTAAAEGARRGVRVNAVAPGPTDTRIMDAVVARGDAESSRAARERMERANPMGRFGRAEEVAGAVVWLLGPDAGYVNGSVISVDGGLTAV